MRNRDYRLPLLIVTALVILADRLSKNWIVAHIKAGSAITLIPGYFRLTHVLNIGAAFSLGESFSPLLVRNVLIGFSVLAVVIVFVMLWRVGRALNPTSIALALILGGAIGNLYDRLVLKHVVDFLEVKIIHYHWPDFNVADSCIVIGACLLILEIFRPQQEV
ncbi:signal peptidase II [Granulicella arctica]|uniref:signal peptidase II n=1 Tax=Granulicella arctica TaxID=940613 RepID=UPI0021E03837|nr:signal peptidase II [Granulicella arctica]